MTSYRKAAANKLNASLSTGPRTLGGKLRSSRNAFRHGLATPVVYDPCAAVGIDRLARALSVHSNGFMTSETAIEVAEAHFDLMRIRAARAEVLSRIERSKGYSDSDVILAVAGVKKLARYERRARSKLRKGITSLIAERKHAKWQNEPTV